MVSLLHRATINYVFATENFDISFSVYLCSYETTYMYMCVIEHRLRAGAKVVGSLVAIPVACGAAGIALAAVTVAAPIYGVYRLVRHVRRSSGKTSSDDSDVASTVDVESWTDGESDILDYYLAEAARRHQRQRGLEELVLQHAEPTHELLPPPLLPPRRPIVYYNVVPSRRPLPSPTSGGSLASDNSEVIDFTLFDARWNGDADGLAGPVGRQPRGLLEPSPPPPLTPRLYYNFVSSRRPLPPLPLDDIENQLVTRGHEAVPDTPTTARSTAIQRQTGLDEESDILGYLADTEGESDCLAETVGGHQRQRGLDTLQHAERTMHQSSPPPPLPPRRPAVYCTSGGQLLSDDSDVSSVVDLAFCDAQWNGNPAPDHSTQPVEHEAPTERRGLDELTSQHTQPTRDVHESSPQAVDVDEAVSSRPVAPPPRRPAVQRRPTTSARRRPPAVPPPSRRHDHVAGNGLHSAVAVAVSDEVTHL